MLFDKKASEIPQFVVVLAIAVVLGAVAIWAILSNIGTQGGSIADWINSIAVPAAHPYFISKPGSWSSIWKTSYESLSFHFLCKSAEERSKERRNYVA